MSARFSEKQSTRREMLRNSAAFAGSALLAQLFSANGEILMLQYFQPAHTDSDIYIHFQKANVIHMGDTFFNASYRSSTPAPVEKSTG
jgi:hypothetical protein